MDHECIRNRKTAANLWHFKVLLSALGQTFHKSKVVFDRLIRVFPSRRLQTAPCRGGSGVDKRASVSGLAHTKKTAQGLYKLPSNTAFIEPCIVQQVHLRER